MAAKLPARRGLFAFPLTADGVASLDATIDDIYRILRQLSGVTTVASGGNTLLLGFGVPGMDGQDGSDGVPVPGATGSTGAKGDTGATGADGTPGGPPGPPGWARDGDDGYDGAPGPPGPTGGSGAGGAIALLEQHTASSSASLDFTTAISATYDEYLIEFVNVVPASDNVDLWMRMSTDGGATYDSGSNYGYAVFVHNTGGSTDASPSSASATKIRLVPDSDNGSTYAMNGTLHLYNPASAVVHKSVSGQFNYRNNNNQYYNILVSGWYLSATAVNAFQFLMSSGNIASGTIRIYGIAKT